MGVSLSAKPETPARTLVAMSTPPPTTGMHPELETAEYFPDLHTTLAVLIKFAIAPHLPVGYAVAVEQGSNLGEGGEVLRYVPDVRIDQPGHEGPGGMAVAEPATLTADAPSFVVGAPPQPQRYLAIRYFGDDPSVRGALVTTIELLSPANKTGEGYVAFEEKQAALASHGVHLVEVDLLRGGRRRWRDRRVTRADYVTTVLRAGNEDASVWEVSLGHALPKVPVPLRAPDADVAFDLEAVLREYVTKMGLASRLARLR